MKKHRLTTADIGAKPENFFQNIRDYVNVQSEQVFEIYVDPTIYEYFTQHGHFSFDGEKMYMWGIHNKITLIRDPPEDRSSEKTRHIIRYVQPLGSSFTTDYVYAYIICYINKQPSYIENIFLDSELYKLCKYGYSAYIIRSFDNSKLWASPSRWGRVPLLTLPAELEMLD